MCMLHEGIDHYVIYFSWFDTTWKTYEDVYIFCLQQLVSEKDLIVREEACRIGLLFGGFTGSYHALRCLLRKLRKKEAPLNA